MSGLWPAQRRGVPERAAARWRLLARATGGPAGGESSLPVGSVQCSVSLRGREVPPAQVHLLGVPGDPRRPVRRRGHFPSCVAWNLPPAPLGPHPSRGPGAGQFCSSQDSMQKGLGLGRQPPSLFLKLTDFRERERNINLLFHSLLHSLVIIFKTFYLFFFRREGKEERKGGRETSVRCFPHIPTQALALTGN